MREIPLIISWEQAIKLLEQELELNLNLEQETKLKQFYELMFAANQLMNLTKLASLPDFLTFHLLDTALVANEYKKLTQSKQIQYIDLGSGCGVPGIILHILLMPDFEITTTLCESRTKRAEYLTKTLSELALDKFVKVEAQRSETLAAQKNYAKNFNLLTARAFAKPIECLKSALPFLSKQGVFIAQTTNCLKSDPNYLGLVQKLKLHLPESTLFKLADKPRFVSAICRKL